MNIAVIAKMPHRSHRYFVQFKDTGRIPEPFENFLIACGIEEIWDEECGSPNTYLIEQVDWEQSREFLLNFGFEVKVVEFDSSDYWWPDRLRGSDGKAEPDFNYILSLEDYDERIDS